MRAARRHLLITVLGLTAALGLASCGVAADDTAATVGGVPISASLVNELAADDPFMGALASQALETQREGVVAGDSARQVLSFLITNEVLAQEVQRWGAEVDSDHSQAEQQIDEAAPGLKGRARDVVLRYLLDRAALQARFSELDPSSEEDMRKLYDGIPAYWDQVCMTAVAVPADSIAAARAALADGAELEDLEGAAEGSTVVATPEQCIPVQSLPEPLRDRVTDGRTGVLVGPVEDVFDGDDAVVWLRVESSGIVPFEEAGPFLEQLIQTVVQQGVESWLNLRVNQDVVVDPRYGSEVNVGQQGLTVVPPATPLGTVDPAAAAQDPTAATP